MEPVVTHQTSWLESTGVHSATHTQRRVVTQIRCDTAVLMQELEGSNLDCAMAQHLLVAADRFQLPRLRRICERRLCETVEVLILCTSALLLLWVRDCQ